MSEQVLNSLIEELNKTQYESSTPKNFENSLEKAFKFLGFNARQIGGSGDTDVVAIANIGKEKFSIIIEGKTTSPTGSSEGRITDSRINWQALKKHKKMHTANYVVIVGPDFSTRGDIITNAAEVGATLLNTSQLIDLLKNHHDYPFSLRELKDLFAGGVDISAQLDEISNLSSMRKTLIKKFKTIIEEMDFLQSKFDYFTIESLAARNNVIDLEIDFEELQDVIRLFSLPFINVVESLSDDKNHYINTIKTKDISNIFTKISNLIVESETETPAVSPTTAQEFGYNFYELEMSGQSVILWARRDNPYKQFCPLIHFKKVLTIILNYLKENTVVNIDNIVGELEGKELSSGRPFRGKRSEGYKISMALGLLEIREFIRWTGSRRPVEFTLNKAIGDLENWINSFGIENQE